MVKKLIPALIICFIATTAFSQHGFIFSSRIGIKKNFTQIIEASKSPASYSGTIKHQYEACLGYRFKRFPIYLETGFTKSYYATKVAIKDGDPLAFGFDKPFKAITQFRAYEIPARIAVVHWSKNKKLLLSGFVGYVYIRNLFELRDRSDLQGTQQRKTNGFTYTFDYDFTDYSIAYDAGRIDFGFSADYILNDYFSLNLRTSLGMGLRPGVARYFNYTIDNNAGAVLKGRPDDIILVDKSDQVSMNIGMNLHINNLFSPQKRK